MNDFNPGDWTINEIRELLRFEKNDYVTYKFTHNRNCVIPRYKFLYFRFKSIGKCFKNNLTSEFMFGEFICKDGEFKLDRSKGSVMLTRRQYENVMKYVKPKKDDLLVIGPIFRSHGNILTYIDTEENWVKKRRMRQDKSSEKHGKIREIDDIKLDSLV